MIWGRVSHSTVIRSGSVPSIRASLSLVHFQIRFPSPHYMRRCSTVSTVAQFPHIYVGTILILWSLTFFGKMSCIILYHSALFVPDIEASPTFFHTLDQSVCDQSLVMRISCVPDSVLSIVWNVSYICLLYVRSDSELPCNGTYAASIAYRLRYSSAGGIQPLKVDCCSVTLDPKYVSIPILPSWSLEIVSFCGGETVHDPFPSC